MSIFGFKYEVERTDDGYYAPAEMQERIYGYFGSLLGVGETPRITGLALYLDLRDKEELLHLMKKPEYAVMLHKAVLQIEDGYEKQILGRSTNGAQFMLRSAFGWKDETVLTVNNTVEGIKNMSDEDILSKLTALRMSRDNNAADE